MKPSLGEPTQQKTVVPEDTPRDLVAYRDKLRGYSAEELYDIYYNIHILRHPLRYKLLKLEMERRRILTPGSQTVSTPLRLELWLTTYALMAHRPRLRTIVLGGIHFALALGLALMLYAPIWICIVPANIRGLLTAPIYALCMPVPVVLALVTGVRLGARGWILGAAVAGAAVAIGLFVASGAPYTLYASIVAPQGSGGISPMQF